MLTDCLHKKAISWQFSYILHLHGDRQLISSFPCWSKFWKILRNQIWCIIHGKFVCKFSLSAHSLVKQICSRKNKNEKKKNEKCPWKHLNIVREGEEGISCKLAWLTDWLASGVWDCPFVNERKFPMRQYGDWWKKKSGDMLNLHSHYSFSKTRSITTQFLCQKWIRPISPLHIL